MSTIVISVVRNMQSMINRKNNVSYAEVSSVTKPTLRSQTSPVPIPRSRKEKKVSPHTPYKEKKKIGTPSSGSPFDASDERVPILVDEKQLNNMCIDLGLTAKGSEDLARKLNKNNLLAPGTKITMFRERSRFYASFFSEEKELFFCKDIPGLFASINLVYNPSEWRLFIDSSKSSLKAVLLHIGNVQKSLPVGYSHTLKENYATMKYLLQCLKYSEHNWIFVVI